MRGIHPGQTWRNNGTGQCWRVAALRGEYVELVDLYSTQHRRVHRRQLHGWRNRPGYHQTSLGPALREMAARAREA